ncbi:DUF7344 domain-containing protein [Halopenitus persicus]|uniref:DUF7344 domain-containing protein n=1 Tax=Halopenitus persicus TaxID=1048396 RepID=UPI0012FD288A|nr:ArsR family transcriptional regulator [Halopenitus persicus]
MAQTADNSSVDVEDVTAELREEHAEIESELVEGNRTEDRRADALPLDQMFDILKNQRRRYVLEYLSDADEAVSLSEIAEQIAAWENDKDVTQISSSERKRVYVGLYQCHLPKMDALDVVSFNKPRGIIELGDNVDELYTYLERTEEPEGEPWHVYSLVLSLAGATVLGSSLLLRPMTTLPIVDIAIVSLIVVLLLYGYVSGNRIWTNRADAEHPGNE